jgi:hypothetical protein
VGKSSLFDAGLNPRLENSHIVKYLRRDPNVGLAAGLKLALAELLVVGDSNIGNPLRNPTEDSSLEVENRTTTHFEKSRPRQRLQTLPKVSVKPVQRLAGPADSASDSLLNEDGLFEKTQIEDEEIQTETPTKNLPDFSEEQSMMEALQARLPQLDGEVKKQSESLIKALQRKIDAIRFEQEIVDDSEGRILQEHEIQHLKGMLKDWRTVEARAQKNLTYHSRPSGRGFHSSH